MPSVALVTGAAQRIGRTISETLHANGYNVVVHFNQSANEAEGLVAALNLIREDSAIALGADLSLSADCAKLAEQACMHWGRLDLLINNASSYFPTPLADFREQDFDSLIGSNLKGAAFLSQACASNMRQSEGSIINMIDSNVLRHPIANHAIYSAAKAGLHGLTLSLARDLAPEVRVNGIAPGAIMWAANETDNKQQENTLARTALGHVGKPADIANAVLFLAQASYVTGYVMKVDGGLNMG